VSEAAAATAASCAAIWQLRQRLCGCAANAMLQWNNPASVASTRPPLRGSSNWVDLRVQALKVIIKVRPSLEGLGTRNRVKDAFEDLETNVI
jgi:hypothetical protein